MSKKVRIPLKLTIKIEKSEELRKKLIELGYEFKEIKNPAVTGFYFFELLEVLDDSQSKKLCDYCDYLNGIKTTY